MHELGVTENILKITLEHAKRAGASQVTDVYLVIGDLSSIVDDSVQFYWDILSQDTLARGAQLHFRRISTEMACLSCNERYLPNGGELACPRCGGLSVWVVSGEEFYLEAIDVEGADSTLVPFDGADNETANSGRRENPRRQRSTGG